MIANDLFTACFGIVPAGDEDALTNIVRNAVRQGFAIVPIAPGQKVPICTLTARQAKAADREAKDAAREAGERGWERKQHECGIAHALTDPAIATRVISRMVKERGPINIGVEVGRSRMVMVDADTAEQVAGFLADWSEQSGHDLTGRRPTVTTPGKVMVAADGEQRWVHKDGGHFWFTIPEGIDLAALPGQGTLRADSGWVAVWRDHQALVPPSVRAEGAYAITGQVEPAPEWLLDRIQLHAHSYAERKARQAERIRHEGDPIDLWSATTPWSDLLDPDGWTDTGLPDRCGCPIWTRPGDSSHYKSATAHELGCTHFDTDSGHGPLHLWTDNPPEFLADAVATYGRRTITKLQYIAWRDHEGHQGAAMSALDLGAIGGDSVSGAELEAMLDDLERTTSSPEPSAPVDVDPLGETAGETGETSAPEPPTDDEAAAIRSQLAADPRLRSAVEELHRRDKARQVYDKILNLSEAKSLRERIDGAIDRLSELTDDEEEDLWRVQDLWMQGQTVLLTAKYKAGKTTMMLNVIRSLVDGKPFLGQFEVTPIEGNLLIVNAEMTRKQFRRWLRESDIVHQEKVYALHVRDAGPSSFNLLDAGARALLVSKLIEVDARALILDPLNPLLASAGVDENASADVARWFNALKEVEQASPVEDTMLVHHFGHNGERGRGSSKFMDHPDALWTYTVEDQPEPSDDDDDLLGQIDQAPAPRFLKAIGRDVDLAKSRVEFDVATRALTMPVIGGGASRAAGKRALADAKRKKLRELILAAVEELPGITFNALFGRIKGNKNDFRAALDELIVSTDVIETPGTNRSLRYSPSPKTEDKSTESAGETSETK
ncbi:AAA family ATPase [Micromonospora sp. NBC_00362]|uniref:AAA family ATPase n=1 Tax=Micromonospora sp. NBC_00362 TaxID=2975975 RepID=UPI00224E2AB6|nr:AAA family ATPase [Micromonospora sp. NBC_00362]MCX5119234.1 AAA family ATPase [Micromonospora sp. NBC_00362]